MQTTRLLLAATFVASVFTLSAAGPNAAEEAAIRKQIAAMDANGIDGVANPDYVSWSGAYKKPSIGRRDISNARTGEGSVPNRVPGSQKGTTNVQRIVVAESKDLAYEYSTFTLAYDTKDGKHSSFDGGSLRVWQKQGGEWRIAAWFSRAFEE